MRKNNDTSRNDLWAEWVLHVEKNTPNTWNYNTIDETGVTRVQLPQNKTAIIKNYSKLPKPNLRIYRSLAGMAWVNMISRNTIHHGFIPGEDIIVQEDITQYQSYNTQCRPFESSLASAIRTLSSHILAANTDLKQQNTVINADKKLQIVDVDGSFRFSYKDKETNPHRPEKHTINHTIRQAASLLQNHPQVQTQTASRQEIVTAITNQCKYQAHTLRKTTLLNKVINELNLIHKLRATRNKSPPGEIIRKNIELLDSTNTKR